MRLRLARDQIFARRQTEMQRKPMNRDGDKPL